MRVYFIKRRSGLLVLPSDGNRRPERLLLKYYTLKYAYVIRNTGITAALPVYNNCCGGGL